MGKACEIAGEEMADESKRLFALRESLREQIIAQLDEVYINGSMEHRLPGNLNMSFAYVEGEIAADGYQRHCRQQRLGLHPANLEPSYVLKALGAGDELAHSSIRFGLGRFNTQAEVDYVVDEDCGCGAKLRELSPLYEMHKEGVDLKQGEVGGRTERSLSGVGCERN